MAETTIHPAKQRYALVTGGNKGIGFEICKQLASKGMMVILTSRSEKRGIEAQEKLKEFGVFDNLIFHQLDVVDPASIDNVVHFIETRYKRLDILVNNAGVSGLEVDGDAMILQEMIEADATLLVSHGKQEALQPKANGKLIETLKDAEECIQTNYYGAKRLTEALIPLLQLSDSPRIVNVSSTLGHLMLLSNEWAKEVLSNEATLTEERIDEVVQKFVKDFQQGSLKENEWPAHMAAYKVSKAALNAYTRCIAKKRPSLYINSACPGLTRTDITYNLGPLSIEEGAQVLVKLALLPDGGPSASFFLRDQLLSL